MHRLLIKPLQALLVASALYTVTLRDATLTDFVRAVEAATPYTFIYSEDVRLDTPITLDARGVPIDTILARAFRHQPVAWELSGRHILLSRRRPPADAAKVHRVTISGYVTDATSSETLIGAGVYDRTSRRGAVTNPFGFYSLTLPAGDVRLSISYLGYRADEQRFTLRRDTVINIGLTDDNLLDEVIVTAPRRDAGIEAVAMGAHELPMTQIRNTPAILGEADLLKTIQLMPGVQAGVEGFSGMYVRGGGGDENLVLLDGTPVYNADHLLGLFSVFTPEAVKKVDFYKSSFPARYGGRLSSIVDVRTNDGDMHRLHGTASLGLLSAKLHLEGPIVRDRTSFLVTARGTWPSLIAGLVQTGSREAYNYYFYDLNAKVNHRFNQRSRLFLSLYHGDDALSMTLRDESDRYYNNPYNPDADNPYATSPYHEETANHSSMRWGNTVASARWNYVFSPRLFSNTTLAFNTYRMALSNRTERVAPDTREYHRYRYDTGIRDLTLRTDFDYAPVPTHRIRFGGEFIHHTFRPETSATVQLAEQDGTVVADTTFRGIASSRLHGRELSLYAEDSFDAGSRLSMNLGLHASLFDVDGRTYLSAQPRATARLRLGHGVALKGAYTEMAQYVHLLTSTPLAMPTDLWVPITRNIRPMRARQYSVGAYYTGLPGWEFSLEAYYKRMHHVLEYMDGASFLGNSMNWEAKVAQGEGSGRGIELLVQKTAGRTTGWLAYTLARSERRFPDGSINHGEPFPYKYDRRHNVSLTLNHRFSARTELAASWVYLSGGTATVPEAQTVAVTPDRGPMQADHITRRNNYRLPASHRLNLSLNLHRPTRRGTATWNFSLYNAYNAMNPAIVYSTHHYTGYGTPQQARRAVLMKVTILPILPSVAYTYRF
jgi:hypothetical protein